MNVFNLGSPPRMRGKPITEAFKADIDRITPAYAGKTILLCACVPHVADHPRVCGENPPRAENKGFDIGSPPRMRGKLPYATKTDLKDGITPAYAGKTSMQMYATLKGQDHPRVCGENAFLD